jgi:MFS family permease
MVEPGLAQTGSRASEARAGESGAAGSGVDGSGSGVSRDGWYCLITVSLGYMLVSWGMNPVSSILPTISADLWIDVSAAGWIMNAYFLLLVGAVLVTGRLGDIFGHRHVFSAGVAIFGLAAVAAGLTGSYEGLVVARSVQGIGAAMVFGTSLALVSEVMPSHRRGFAIGVLTTSSAVAALLGVSFSVYAAERLTWHWAFFIRVSRAPSSRTASPT